jgi:YVTN family beta-propeller protein
MMTDARGTLARIDPATNRTVAEIYVAPGSFTVAFGEAAVWVTSSEQSVVTRVNPLHERRRADDSRRSDAAIPGSREGSVWTLNQRDGTISRIDPNTNAVTATIAAGIPGRGGEIAVGEGSVWATSFEFRLRGSTPRPTASRSSFIDRAATRFVWVTDRCGCPTCGRATCGASIRSGSKPRCHDHAASREP